MKNKECPKCFGSKEVMIPKDTRGFTYIECDFCDENGQVSPTLYEDYILSLNEDEINNEPLE